MTSLLLALALLAGATPPSPTPGVPPAGERVELVVRFPPWQFTGTFTASAGTLVDRGVARDRGALLGPEKTVDRVLEGEKGTLTLRLHSSTRAGAIPSVFGRWEIVSATGAWAGLKGGGTFTSVDAGTGKTGSPFELQTMLGRLTRGR